MYYSTEKIVRDVRVAIDENRKSETLLGEADIDTLSLDELIYEKLIDAARLVEMEASPVQLESGHQFVDPEDRNVYINPVSGKGYVILPEDFMRFISFRMSDWERTVYSAITEGDAEYKLQSSKWRGIYGSPEKPVVAIVRRSEGKVLEFYSSRSSDAYVVQATYQPYPRIEEGGMDIPESCYRAVVYRAASLALASVGDQLSTVLAEISQGLLG